MARPTDYSLETVAEICTRLANGEALRQICMAEDMPAQSTVYLWLARHPEFLEMYARAREEQADTLADDIVAIADSAKAETVQVDRLRVDARKWVAAKLKPRKYGDRVDVGNADGVPFQTVTRIELVAPNGDSTD